MGLFDFVGNAGKKLFSKDVIDERAVRAELMSLGLGIRVLSVIANQPAKKVTLVARVDSLEDKEKLILAAGNIDGVKQVEDRVRVIEPEPESPPAPAEPPAADPGDEAVEPPPEEAPGSQFYTVKSGDTLSEIAQHFYGNGHEYHAIFEANRPMLTDPGKIYPGQVLRIPPEA